MTAKENCIRYIENNARIFTSLSDRIWEQPELSLKEFKAAEAYCSLLKDNGFKVEENLGGIRTAFKASFGNGHPVIGFLGEFDALSGLSQKKNTAEPDPVVSGAPGHGCGHNLLGAGALCAAFAIRDYLERTKKEGTVVFYGCPGEEGGASKAFLARDREWVKLDAALTWHPSDENKVVSGSNNASIQVHYRFHGRSAHAAGDPYNGRSALDAVELMNIGVQFLREHMTEDCRVHYAITDTGGISPNVVQSEAAVLYMVRANKVRDCVALLDRVDRIASGAALMTDTVLDREFIDGTAQLVPNHTLEKVLYSNFEKIPLPVHTPEEIALAEEIKKTCPDSASPEALSSVLLSHESSEKFVPGSTDVGDVSWLTPTAQIHVSAFVSGAPGHSWQNVSTAGGSIGHKALLHAGKILACSAVDLYEDSGILKNAKEEFLERTKEGYVCPIEPDAVPVAI